MRLIGIRRASSLAVFNSGKQGTTVHTVAHLPSFRYAKTVQTACWGPPPIPRQGPLALRTFHRWSGHAPLRALNKGSFTGWERLSSWVRSVRRTRNRPVRSDERTASSGPFPGGKLRTPTSILQEWIYSCKMLATTVLTNPNSCRARKPPRHGRGQTLTLRRLGGTIGPAYGDSGEIV